MVYILNTGFRASEMLLRKNQGADPCDFVFRV